MEGVPSVRNGILERRFLTVMVHVTVKKNIYRFSREIGPAFLILILSVAFSTFSGQFAFLKVGNQFIMDSFDSFELLFSCAFGSICYCLFIASSVLFFEESGKFSSKWRQSKDWRKESASDFFLPHDYLEFFRNSCLY